MQAKRFVTFARVSSVRQAKEGYSLLDQESRLGDFAARLGGTVVQQFKIAETASRSNERLTFRAMVQFVRRNARKLDGILFVKVDRAARNLSDWNELERLSEETRIPLYFPDQPSGDTPSGRMQRRISAVMASYTSDQMSVEIRAGQKRRLESGLPLGKQYGYRNIRINGRGLIEVDPVNGPKVKRIFELFAYSPLTLETLIDTLARQGIVYTDRTPRFTKSTLHRLLHNRIYIGQVKTSDGWAAGAFESLVDLETFEAVRAKFGTDFKQYHRPELTYGGGFITCGHCGCLVSGEKKIKRSPNGLVREYSYYRCGLYCKTGHPRVRVTESDVDREVLKVFKTMRIEDAEVRQWFVDVLRARAKSGQRDNHSHRAELKRQMEVVESKLARLLNMRMDEEIGQEEYAEKRRDLQDRQSGIHLQLQATDVDERELADRAIAAFELSQSLQERWVTSDYRWKREILGVIFETALLNSNGKGFSLVFTVRKPFDVLVDDRFVPITGATGN
jgi:site-specific DNA recombinase